MKYAKYKNLLFSKIKQQISKWFESDGEPVILNTDVYRFLTSLKISSETLQLGGLHQLAGKLMDQIKELDAKQWEKEELRNFLYDLISLTYDYENFKEVEKRTEHSRDENIPLIQIIDDDISMLILLKDVLEEKGWMVIANTTYDKAISQYYDVDPDCVIIDVNLPGKNGIEIIEELQKHTSKLFVPKIIISIVNDRNTRLNAFRKGADDFIEKPIDLEELTVRIERHLQRKQMYDESVLLDELTNLYNRRFLKDVFTRNMNDFKRNGQPFSIAILDIDHFKKINDCFGHLIGDKVLSSFAAFLKTETRNTDTVFRYGGEEFVILYQNTDHVQAIEITSRLLDKFADKQFTSNEETFSVTFSAGVHSITTHEDTMEIALSVADQALYKAKELGRARVEGFNYTTEIAKRKLFISVIDDDAIIRAMLTRILPTMEVDQYEVNIQVFENGLTFFKSNRLDEKGEHFLIVDGVMPKMDGLEILQKVKQTKNGNNIHVLMLTGRKSESDIARALKLGADDYITKPFSITELQARIQRLIQRMR